MNDQQLPPLYSIFAEDPNIKGHLESFVISMSSKIEACNFLIKNKEWESLSKYFHQLKGTYASFGFPELQNLVEDGEEILFSTNAFSDTRKTLLIELTLKMETMSKRALLANENKHL